MKKTFYVLTILTVAILAIIAVPHAPHMALAVKAILGGGAGFLLLGATNGVSYGDAPTTANAGVNTFNADNCSPRMISIDDAMSLTRANITGWNQSDIEGNFFREVGLDKIIAQTKEARMAGTVQRTLMDLLLSRHTPLKIGGGAPGQSVIQPYRLVPRRNRVNPGYFRISAGAASVSNDLIQAGLNQNYVSNGNAVPGALWTITVNNGSIDADSSPFVKSPNNTLKNIEKYFLKRKGLTVEWADQTAGTKYTSVCHVVGAFNVDANQAKVIISPNRSFAGGANFFGNGGASGTWWDSATTPQKAAFQPITGICRLQSKNVSDYESDGDAVPGYNEYGLITYWHGTFRWTHKYNDEYVKALTASTTSDGLRKFRLLPLAKLRAQQEFIHENEFFETCFYGDIEDENQTDTGWQSLPQVVDPTWAASGESGTLAIEYRARPIGIRTQIAACGNVLDTQNGPLDLDSLFEAGYYVRREREGESGREVTDIDVMTDMRFTRPLLRQLMTKYYKAKYGLDNITGFVQWNQKITHNGQVMFEFDSYDLPDYGYTLNVFSSLYFDDRIAQFQNSQKSAGRQIWMIDWSDINIGLIKSMSVPRMANAIADAIYGLKYVIQPNVQHILLNSKTFEVAVGNTNRHRIIENYSDACAKLTVPGCDLSA